MNWAGIIIIALLMFGLIILVHELGHFVTAKLVGIRVEEFAIGMGPTLLKFPKEKRNPDDTTYAIHLVPIGGFVMMEGEDEKSDSSTAFCNKKIWERILVIVAGASMNLLMGFIIMFSIVMMQPVVSSTQISYFAPTASSSQKLQLGDEIVKINNSKIHIANDLMFAFISAGKDPIDITVKRNGENVEIADVPFKLDTLEDGTQMPQLDFKIQGVKKNPANVMKESWFMTTGVVKEVWTSFGKLITGQFKLNQLSGPVGVTEAIGQVANQAAQAKDSSNLLMMLAFITINIGVFNLLPLPALDGGRLVFIIIEAIRGKPIPAKYEGYVHAAGLFLLMGLMVVVTFNDVFKLIKK